LRRGCAVERWGTPFFVRVLRWGWIGEAGALWVRYHHAHSAGRGRSATDLARFLMRQAGDHVAEQRHLNGKVAIVTGGAGGMGSWISRVFAEQGAQVMVADTGADVEGRDDLEEAVADRHEEVTQPEARDAGVAVADL